MILYHLAKRMEQRTHLTQLIAETEGDSALAIKREKASLERQRLMEAYQWIDPAQAAKLALLPPAQPFVFEVQPIVQPWEAEFVFTEPAYTYSP
ncbi:MAG: hypothetical protein K0Q59_1499 [Paenibacillus sp.]|jgi:hypothetical protein|nr:hypothetical protein [Paenibacillus sp.]